MNMRKRAVDMSPLPTYYFQGTRGRLVSAMGTNVGEKSNSIPKGHWNAKGTSARANQTRGEAEEKPTSQEIGRLQERTETKTGTGI